MRVSIPFACNASIAKDRIETEIQLAIATYSNEIQEYKSNNSSTHTTIYLKIRGQKLQATYIVGIQRVDIEIKLPLSMIIFQPIIKKEITERALRILN